MEVFLDAVYKNGTLILNEKLGNENEGKKFKVIIYEQKPAGIKKQEFFEFMEKRNFKLPDDYKFDRDNLHER